MLLVNIPQYDNHATIVNATKLKQYHTTNPSLPPPMSLGEIHKTLAAEANQEHDPDVSDSDHQNHDDQAQPSHLSLPEVRVSLIQVIPIHHEHHGQQGQPRDTPAPISRRPRTSPPPSLLPSHLCRLPPPPTATSGHFSPPLQPPPFFSFL